MSNLECSGGAVGGKMFPNLLQDVKYVTFGDRVFRVAFNAVI